MFRAAKHVDDIDPLAGFEHVGQMPEVGDRSLAQHRSGSGCDGDHTVAEILQRAGHPVARAGRVGRQPYDGDHLCGTQELGNLGRRGILEHASEGLRMGFG